jgi:hypothetical protein
MGNHRIDDREAHIMMFKKNKGILKRLSSDHSILLIIFPNTQSKIAFLKHGVLYF